MSCNISKFDFCMLQQETFKSPIFNFGDIDVSDDTFVYTVFKSYGASKKEFTVNFIDDNTVYIEDIKMPLGDYQHELIWIRNGIKEVVFQGSLKITDKGNNCGCTTNKLDIKVVHEDVVVKVNYSERIVNNFIWSGSVLSFEVNENMELVMNETIPTSLEFGLNNGYLTIEN